ncbi:hypothetical protein [Rhodanobacter umsongensis]
MAIRTEKELDAALEKAFKEDEAFAQWFLARTKFAHRGAKYFWSRSDHPWGRIPYATINTQTGASEISLKESETDVLVVFQAQDEEFLALHIENKIGSGKFTALQPELYAPRAEHWKGNPKYGAYTDYQTILVAPRIFQERNKFQAHIFDCFIAHEEIAGFIPLFTQSLSA